MQKVLIIEDDVKIAELLSIHLTDIHFEVEIHQDGLSGYQQAIKGNHDLLLLDLMLPTMDGVEICRKIRAQDGDTPIIMITSKSEEIDRVLGLETGADDYIVKPFSVRELQARVKAVMRRSRRNNEGQSPEGAKLSFESLNIDTDKRIVTKNDKRVEMTPKEFDLLALLGSNPGKSFNRQSILNLVWGYEFEGFEHTVNSHINRLRAKIEDDMSKPKYIITTWGYGYRFNENI